MTEWTLSRFDVLIAIIIVLIIISVGVTVCEAIDLVQSLVAFSRVRVNVWNLKLELSDWMESEFISSVSNSIASAISTGIRVTSFHNKRLAVILQPTGLFNFNSVLRSKPKIELNFCLSFKLFQRLLFKLTQT